jgi:pimeloyl-ACP methyl ester carboxylesterase
MASEEAAREARRRWPRWPRWVAAVAATGAVLALLPPLQARAKAAAALAEALDLPVPRPFAADITRERAAVGGVAGDLYAPDRPVPAVLLVPGATPAGVRDPRAVAVAEAYARAGRAVFVPELTLYERRFEEHDIEALVRAALGLARREGAGGRVTLVAFSYGGSFALIAAADPRLGGVVEHIGVFGAYHDLVGVIQAATTGVSLVDGEEVPWDPHPAADDIVREQALALVSPAQRRELEEALDGARDPEALPDEAGALHALLVNTDAARTFPLAERLPPEIQARLARFSPATVAERVTVPVSILHSTDDPAVPYGEALRLGRDLPDARLYTVGLFRHVDFRPGDAGAALDIAGDLVRTWRFAGRLLAAQERALMARARTPRAPALVSPAA